MGDIYYGVVPLPDGRQCRAIVYGVYHSQTWDESGYFEERENNPLEIEDIDGQEFDESEYEKEYEIKEEKISLYEFCVNWLIEHGEFEPYDFSDKY